METIIVILILTAIIGFFGNFLIFILAEFILDNHRFVQALDFALSLTPIVNFVYLAINLYVFVKCLKVKRKKNKEKKPRKSLKTRLKEYSNDIILEQELK